MHKCLFQVLIKVLISVSMAADGTSARYTAASSPERGRDSSLRSLRMYRSCLWDERSERRVLRRVGQLQGLAELGVTLHVPEVLDGESGGRVVVGQLRKAVFPRAGKALPVAHVPQGFKVDEGAVAVLRLEGRAPAQCRQGYLRPFLGRQEDERDQALLLVGEAGVDPLPETGIRYAHDAAKSSRRRR